MNDQPYDPFIFETWPEEQKDFVSSVQHGLLDGDLQPLADYLRAGHYVFPNLATTIADAIESRDMPFRIITKGVTRSPLNTTQRVAQEAQKWNIGVFAEVRARHHGKGKSKLAIGDAMKKFDVTQTVVTDARAAVLKILRDAPAELRERVWEAVAQHHSAYIG